MTSNSSLRLWGLCATLLFGAFAAEATEILFVAGKPSHGFGSHEHYAGCRLLAASIQNAYPDVKTTVVRGWPSDDALLERADSIVVYCDGGGRHVVLPHREQMQQLMAAGKGFVCLHYAVEVPKGEPGDDFLHWLGGYFETDWSVNPHWDAEIKQLPEHPVTRGVEPFTARDEWYFHMRFRPEMEGVTPILSAVPPAETMSRPDGPHSGNPAVRKAVAAKEPQHVAWTFDRPDGGRSFGFTGGHFHWNWGRTDIRKLVCNAIVWTAGVEVPKGGTPTGKVEMNDLLKNQDYEPPKKFDREQTKKEFHLTATEKSTTAAQKKNNAQPRVLFTSPLMTTATSRHQIDIDVPLKGAKRIFLVATDGGDGLACDWVDWVNPRLVGSDGEIDLTEQPMLQREAGWGEVRVGSNAAGGQASIRGTPVSPVIGTHAPSVIGFAVPSGAERLLVTGGLDTGGTQQNDGATTSVRLRVYADAVPATLAEIDAQLGQQQRQPENAIRGLQIAEGLEATLVASEPTLKSLTNIDIDARGRIWACEVMNYRRHNGRRPEGDRILILEDTDGDGRADTHKVYYQGRDIDSAMGICVLGNEVIVSASPHVWKFTDLDGDDVPDKKELMFDKTGQPQHDHSAHSFLFGPDGKLYWNFGNTGQGVYDANGDVVVDIHGRPVLDNGDPFYGGMPFRCNLDGSEFEVLAHNFRNNYEVTVDSFGNLWQSDNDDDGNRATRINFVIEQGNYGYRDQRTGASWREPRIGMHEEIPLRHWHLRDPGVMPNLLQTGAGSPTGITVYEGDLLPEWLQGEVIHCDAGPNVVRAYPAERAGAGFTATARDLVVGEPDRWFRPADVCVAPDGSIFISDWYDPGVGGHRMEDLDRGRLFRIAPPGAAYRVPEHDLTTIDGAIAALRSPAASVRYLAWQALFDGGDDAAAALEAMYEETDPVMRARALWLLGKRPGGATWVKRAIADDDERIRTVGVRLGRQLKMPATEIAASLINDPSPAVRRELLVSLRFDESAAMPKQWAQLAAQYDGEDRWYLESLGIASDLRPDECLAAWLNHIDRRWDTPAGRDIVWRVQADAAALLIADILTSSKQSLDQTERYFHSLELREKPQRDAALQRVLEQLVSHEVASVAQRHHDAIITHAVERLDGNPLADSEAIREAVVRHAERAVGSPEFIDLVARFNLRSFDPQLVEMAIDGGSEGVRAAELLLGRSEERNPFADILLQPEPHDAATQLASTLGLVGKPPAIALLVDVIRDAELPFATRSAAVRGLAKSNLGEKRLIRLAEKSQLPDDLELVAGSALSGSQDDAIRTAAAKLLPMPEAADQTPLPPLDQLVAMSGDAARGKELFNTKATCANCHVVRGKGKEVGPDLSEIGSKLAKDAMYISILAPSAGISHNYENYVALLDSGQIITGVKVNETANAITLRTAEAIDRVLPKDEIERIQKSEKSIMPENLHHTIDQQGLVDIVEYLMQLKKPEA